MRYRELISNFDLLDLHDMWFQQDGATCHTSRITMDLLRGEFGEHFISHSGPVKRSWLRDYVKAHVFTDKSASTDALEDNIGKSIQIGLSVWTI